MSEQWKPVLGYEGIYAVSDQGRVRNSKTGSIRRAFPRSGEGKGKHLIVRLFKDGKGKGFLVHRLVLMSFRPRQDGEGEWALHRNGVDTDNRLENLYWGSASENALDSVKHRTHRGASRNLCSRGHRLEGSNLAIRGSGKRACRSCDAGRVAVKRGSALSVQEHADRIYRELHS